MLKNIPDVNLMVDISAQLRKPPSEENKFLASRQSQLEQVSSITGDDQAKMSARTAKQAQFVQDVLRSYIGGR